VHAAACRLVRPKFRQPTSLSIKSEWILRHQKDHIYTSVCRFFDTDARRCTVYEARPYVCRKYPYGNKCGYYAFLKFEREHQADEEFVPKA